MGRGDSTTLIRGDPRRRPKGVPAIQVHAADASKLLEGPALVELGGVRGHTLLAREEADRFHHRLTRAPARAEEVGEQGEVAWEVARDGIEGQHQHLENIIIARIILARQL